ncbi:MAG: 4-(cytidine 5'-diphospho)-2-C-methyl-D-erythritol kinase [Bacteroidetes bacterium]|nr:MAG: 4-(cytidine 5'-diphospho)-2-C-methyl-D-erythritol kinase [Bacteroidota bacterium]
MLSFPNSKINLGLSVTEKRSDGFHDIESLMMPVGLCDILEVIISPDTQFSFTTSGLKINGGNNQNLVIKAWQLLRDKFNLPAVRIHLHKVVPMGAGLGGGSSDAAFLIKNINSLFNIGLTIKQMQGFALELGSDCPFFIENKPVIARGRGEVFEDVKLNLKHFNIVIIKPDFHIDTSVAYSQIIPTHKAFPVKDIIGMPVNKWKGYLINDFEKPVFEQFPSIRKIKEQLYKMGATYTSMSGSGSSVFGLFRDVPDINPKFPDCFVWTGEL